MIVNGCIEIHPKDCRGWIIVTGFMILLITQHLFREILVEAILGVHERGVKIKKKFIDPDIVTMHLLHKGFIEKYMCWYAHEEPFVPHETMVERMVESTSSAINMHRVETNNNNPPYMLWMWWQWIKVMSVNVQS